VTLVRFVGTKHFYLQHPEGTICPFVKCPQLPQNHASDGTIWEATDPDIHTQGCCAQQNVLKEVHGPTQYAKRNISEDSVASARCLFTDKSIQLHIRKCPETETHTVLQDNSWSITLHKLEEFIAIMYACGVSDCRNIELHSLWSESWGLPFCMETMSQNHLCEIMRFLRQIKQMMLVMILKKE
jgi:hypothetical protein